MRRDFAQLQALEPPSGSFILQELALLQQHSGRMNDIGTLLDQTQIAVLVVDADTIQGRRLEHPHIAIQNTQSTPKQ